MTSLLATTAAGVGLAAATYALRISGTALGDVPRLTRARRLVDIAAVVLLVGVLATSTFTEEQHLGGIARPAGVAIALVLAWQRVSILLVVLAAVLTTATLRLLGVP